MIGKCLSIIQQSQHAKLEELTAKLNTITSKINSFKYGKELDFEMPMEFNERMAKRKDELTLLLSQQESKAQDISMCKELAELEEYFSLVKDYEALNIQVSTLKSRLEVEETIIQRIFSRSPDDKRSNAELVLSKDAESKKQLMEIVKKYGFSFQKCVEMLRDNNEPLVLDAIDCLFLVNANPTRSIEDLADLVCVHLTRFQPKNNKILSGRAHNSIAEIRTVLEGALDDTYESKKNLGTVHMTINGEVTAHANGSWDDCKYAVLFGFDTVVKNENIRSVNTGDTWVGNSVNYGNKSSFGPAIILCPKDEMKQVLQNNPGCRVIGVDDISVHHYSNTIIRGLGYRRKEIEDNGWSTDNRPEDSAMFFRICQKYNLPQNGPHFTSKDNAYRKAINGIEDATVALNTIKLHRKRLFIDKSGNENDKQKRAEAREKVTKYIFRIIKDKFIPYKKETVESIDEISSYKLLQVLKSLGFVFSEEEMDDFYSRPEEAATKMTARIVEILENDMHLEKTKKDKSDPDR